MGKTAKPNLETRSSPFTPAAGVVFIALITFIVYSPVLRAGYIWDDDTALTENSLIRSFSGLRDIWFSTKPYDYFPLTFTSFWLEWRLWGMNAAGYHVVNVLLHALGAILFWRVLLRLIPQCGIGAWLAALMFAIHPICVASVAWVAERKNTLSLVFYLLSILCFLRFAPDSIDTQRRKRKWYWLSILAFLLALLSKTSVVTLPFVLWLCLWWRRSQNSEVIQTAASPRIRPNRLLLADLRRLAPFFALALILGLATVWFQTHRAMSGNLYQRDGLGVRLLGGTWAVWFYLGKTLLPVRLNMIYPRWEVDPQWVWTYVPALAWGMMLGVCWWFRRSWGGTVLLGLGSFFVTLLPVLGFFDMSFFVYARAADHLMYLALLGLIALVVSGASAGMQSSSWPFRLVAGLVVVALSILSWNRARVFNGQESLWRDTLAKNRRAWAAYNNLGMATKNPVEEFNCYVTALRLNPNYVDAHNNLGVVLYQRGKTEEATRHFREALRLYPGSASAHNNLGGVLMNQGKADEARWHLQQALQINPYYVDARNNLGLVLIRQGQMAEAKKQFETSLRLNSNQPDAYYNLGNISFHQGRFADAVALYGAALRFKPNSSETYHNLGMALAAMGRLNEALAEFNIALKLKPDFGPTQYQLAEVLLKQGRRAEATKWYMAAVQNQPESAEVQHRLGLVLAEEQNAGEAIQHLREAVRLKPDWAEALNDLASMLATQTEANLRDGTEAVRLATQANQLAGGTNVNVLDTLAAAFAEAGEYAEATRTARRALDLLRSSSQTNFAVEIEGRLRLYESGKPFRGNLKPGQ